MFVHPCLHQKDVFVENNAMRALTNELQKKFNRALSPPSAQKKIYQSSNSNHQYRDNNIIYIQYSPHHRK
jgi:hypothetical protein